MAGAIRRLAVIGCLLLLPRTAAAGEHVSLLADLPPAVLAALPADLDPPLRLLDAAAQLQAVFDASTPYEFDVGSVIVQTDPRWFSTLAPGSPPSSVLELRRWPGDTRLLLYGIEGPISAARGAKPPVANADFVLQDGTNEGFAEWHGVIHTEIGDVPAIWIEAPAAADSAVTLGALLLPGDAGLGPAAVDDLTAELRAVLGRISIRQQVWARQAGLPPGQLIDIGAVVATPAAKAEEFDPWQVALATEFTIGVPPGVQARRTDAGVPPPVEIPGGRLWLRGRFRDIEGADVVIGDATRAGYVARVEAPDAAWAADERAPVGAPGAELIATATFSLVKEPFVELKKRSDVRMVRAGRWKEAGFGGEWLVFRLLFAGSGFEVGLPMVDGRRSPSVFWIPATWRAIDEPPAAPPVDPAARFGIRWERLTRGELAKRPWVEGILSVPGLKAELPREWWPAATLRSTDGFPIRLLDREGTTVGRLSRLAPEKVPALVTGEGSGWAEQPRPAVNGAAAIYRHEDGAFVFVPREGHAYLLEIVTAASVDPLAWGRLRDSIQLVRSGP